MTFLEVGFGGNLVQGFRAYAWRAVPSFPQITLCFPSFALRPQPLCYRTIFYLLYYCQFLRYLLLCVQTIFTLGLLCYQVVVVVYFLTIVKLYQNAKRSLLRMHFDIILSEILIQFNSTMYFLSWCNIYLIPVAFLSVSI